MVFLCVFDTFTFLFAVVALSVVLGTFLGLLWALLAPPWRSLGCLGVSKAALGDHFGLTLRGLGLPRPLFWRATAACCALWGPSEALWRPWVAPWPLFWRATAAFLGGFLVASNMHRKSQIFWQSSSAGSTKSYKATPRTGIVVSSVRVVVAFWFEASNSRRFSQMPG